VLTVILSAVMAGISLSGTAPNIKAISNARVAASNFFELMGRKLGKSKQKYNYSYYSAIG